MNTKNHLSRSAENTKRQKIIVSAEGKKTERAYIKHLNRIQTDFHIELVPYKDSAPINVFRALREYVADISNRLDLKYWIVVDRDEHYIPHFEEIVKWCKTNKKYNLAVSNPCFELWLIFHHEDYNDFTNHQECINYYYRKYGNRRKKRAYLSELTIAKVKDAVNRAKNLDTTNTIGWPIESGCTTVYRIIEDYF